jgi:hypothetical protein
MATIQSPPFGIPYVPARPRAGSGTRRDSELDRVRSLARVLDRFFVDPILGLLVPGGGDILGSLLGVYTVVIAARRKVSPVVVARMLMNLAGDALLGFIPLVGDVFDFGFKANQRNLDLLENRVEAHGGRATPKDWFILIGAVLAFLAVVALVVWGVVRLVRAIA